MNSKRDEKVSWRCVNKFLVALLPDLVIVDLRLLKTPFDIEEEIKNGCILIEQYREKYMLGVVVCSGEKPRDIDARLAREDIVLFQPSTSDIDAELDLFLDSFYKAQSSQRKNFQAYLDRVFISKK